MNKFHVAIAMIAVLATVLVGGCNLECYDTPAVIVDESDNAEDLRWAISSTKRPHVGDYYEYHGDLTYEVFFVTDDKTSDGKMRRIAVIQAGRHRDAPLFGVVTTKDYADGDSLASGDYGYLGTWTYVTTIDSRKTIRLFKERSN